MIRVAFRQLVIPCIPGHKPAEHVRGRRSAREARHEDLQGLGVRDAALQVVPQKAERLVGNGGEALVIALFAGGEVSAPLVEVVRATNAHHDQLVVGPVRRDGTMGADKADRIVLGRRGVVVVVGNIRALQLIAQERDRMIRGIGVLRNVVVGAERCQGQAQAERGHLVAVVEGRTVEERLVENEIGLFRTAEIEAAGDVGRHRGACIGQRCLPGLARKRFRIRSEGFIGERREGIRQHDGTDADASIAHERAARDALTVAGGGFMRAWALRR